jgi:predicted nucleotide-binding protein (sugar kinase/HSP70/actin superfamily)
MHIIFYPKEQKEQKEQKSKKKKQSNFLFAEKVETLHKNARAPKNFIKLLLVFYSTKNKDDVVERLREIQREDEEREEDATTATGTLSTRWWGGRRE